ncbi:hypothetical protein SDC9_123824 [bioreactor metagenome]|uniref:Uncharacterized protein n=1 Tax=bioreactor metagenome TaxID=1076179 RepID=A0A645CIP9_9ZZZZ
MLDSGVESVLLPDQFGALPEQFIQTRIEDIVQIPRQGVIVEACSLNSPPEQYVRGRGIVEIPHTGQGELLPSVEDRTDHRLHGHPGREPALPVVLHVLVDQGADAGCLHHGHGNGAACGQTFVGAFLPDDPHLSLVQAPNKREHVLRARIRT